MASPLTGVLSTTRARHGGGVGPSGPSWGLVTTV
jgi:hypothetical protein